MQEKRTYFLEFTRVGNQMKVIACDPDTGTEAMIFGPVTARKKDLSDLAIRKLRYVMNKGDAEGLDVPGNDK